MKKVLMLAFVIMFASSSVMASETFFEVYKGSSFSAEDLSSIQVKEISSMLENIYKENDVMIKFQIPADNSNGDSQEFWNEYVNSEFYEQGLDIKATPTLNLLVVLRLDKEGMLNLNIGFSDTCGWDMEKLGNAINKNQEDSFSGYNDYIMGIIETIKKEFESANSFNSVCSIHSFEESKCKNLFVENQGDYKSVLIIPTDYSGKDIDVENMIREVVLGLKVNSVWSENFEKIKFVYYDEIQKIRKKCDSYSDFRCLSETAWDIQAECGADQFIVISQEDFRSFAFSGQGVFLSVPYNKKDFEFKEDFYNYFERKSSALIHETGHSLFCLSDEYVEMVDGSYDNSRNEPEYPNCASSVDEAEEWWGSLIGLEGVDYYDGCAYVPGNIRPHEKSSMSNPRVKEYGFVSDKYIADIFGGIEEC